MQSIERSLGVCSVIYYNPIPHYDFVMTVLFCFVGTYITTADALDLSISEEDIWSNNDFERAISLIAVRSLFFTRAGGLIGSDKDIMHGKLGERSCLSLHYSDDSLKSA